VRAGEDKENLAGLWIDLMLEHGEQTVETSDDPPF